jgi:hypothetical protein
MLRPRRAAAREELRVQLVYRHRLYGIIVFCPRVIADGKAAVNR